MNAKGKKTKKKSRALTASKGKKRSTAKKMTAKKASNKKSVRVSRTSTKKAKRKPKKSSAWKISPEKFGATDIWVFKKDGVTIELSQNYQISFIIVAQKPNLTKYDPDKGINIDKFKCSYLGVR